MTVSFALSTVSSGCLVTEDLKFQSQDDVPPAFVFRPRSQPPIGDTLRIDTDALEQQNITNLRFRLQVRDENLQQDLETQIRLRTLVSPTYSEVRIRDAEPGPMIPGLGSATRDVELSIQTTELRDGHCHQLQLAVSGAFIQSDEDPIFAVPVLSDDIAIATWWLWETSADTVPDVDLDTCPTSDFDE